jgi:hypothetical protein
MTTLEAGPGTLLIAATYVQTLEDRLRNADERAEQSELQLLLVREEARQTCERAAELHEQAVEHLRAEVPVDDKTSNARDEMTLEKTLFRVLGMRAANRNPIAGAESVLGSITRVAAMSYEVCPRREPKQADGPRFEWGLWTIREGSNCG